MTKTKTKKKINRNTNTNTNTNTNIKTRKKINCPSLLDRTVYYHSFEDVVTKEIDERALINKKQNLNYKNFLIKSFATPYAPSKYTPRSDFYTYINYVWIEDKTKFMETNKKFYTQLDSFRVVQEKVYYELMDIVKQYISKNKNKKANEIKNVYKSMLNLNGKRAEYHINNSIRKIDELLTKGNLINLLSFFNQNEIVSWSSPISWTISPDEKNSNFYRSHIGPPILSAYDYKLYIEDTEDDQNTKKYKKLYKLTFLKFVKKMFDECIDKNHGLNPQDVWDVEYEMLIAMGCDKVKNDSTEYYNKVNKQESFLKYQFDWVTFSKNIGFNNTPDFFICSSLNYLKCIMETLNTNDVWKSSKWRTYYIYMYVKQIIRFHNKWRHIYFDFFGNFVKGEPTIWPNDIYPTFGLSICFNTFLTNEYIERNKKDAYIDYVENMASDLLTVFKRVINRNTWLSPNTKKYALLKLKYLKLVVGSPKILRQDPLLNYSNDDAWDNLSKISSWRIKKYISLEGSPIIDIPEIDWMNLKLTGSQAYIVNAYYTPTLNSIYIPLGYLQPPFIDLTERGLEYNLAHIGYTLSHEMSHALDDIGSKYDYNGNLKNWWTPKDRKIFNMKVNDIVNQYETFASYDGIKMDASLSTGENLADISGLAICEEYLRHFQLKNKDITRICALQFQTFYVYIAIQSRQKIYDKAIKAQLLTNPHPMNKYRTNCPLARLKLFQSMYNIKKGDKMYWASTDTIW
jgi:predicted metalloendopeptidase